MDKLERVRLSRHGSSPGVLLIKAPDQDRIRERARGHRRCRGPSLRRAVRPGDDGPSAAGRQGEQGDSVRQAHVPFQMVYPWLTVELAGKPLSPLTQLPPSSPLSTYGARPTRRSCRESNTPSGTQRAYTRQSRMASTRTIRTRNPRTFRRKRLWTPGIPKSRASAPRGPRRPGR